MNLGSHLVWIILYALVFLITGCEHRPLVDRLSDKDMRYIRVYLDEEIRNVSFGFYNESLPKPYYRSPEVLRVALCDMESGSVLSEAYLTEKGKDERGNYLAGYITAVPGHYRLLAYNFDTESVHIGYEYNYGDMYAYTNPISEELYGRLRSVRAAADEDSWRIVYEPDHLFIKNDEEVMVEEHTDTLYAQGGEHFIARTGVKSYYLQVEVTGAELVTSAVALLSGMAGSIQLKDGQMCADDPVAVHFELNNGKDKERSEKTIAYTTFHTFGKLEEQENYLSITFEFHTKSGQTVTETIPLTELFDTPLVKENQWILIDRVIAIDDALKIEDEGGGGMNPNVGEWENTEGEIYI